MVVKLAGKALLNLVANKVLNRKKFMISIKLQVQKGRLKCTCFEISASILNTTLQTLQQHVEKNKTRRLQIF